MDFEPVEEVPLHEPPLALVVAQVRFSRTPGLADDNGEKAIAALLADFPVRNNEQGVITLLDDPSQRREFLNRAFATADSATKVVVGDAFVSVATTRYEGRRWFLARLREALAAVAQVDAPPQVQRVGVRYVNRLHGDLLSEVTTLVRPEMLGGIPGNVIPVQQVTQSMFRINDYDLFVRTALLPPDQVTDPSIAPVPSRSWVLDTDAALETPTRFDVDTLTATATELADLCHSTFRWAVTDKFLATFKNDG